MTELITELSYVFKYADIKAYDNNETEWVIRQVGLYQHFNTKTDSAIWMMIMPNQNSFCPESVVNMLELKHPLYAHMDILSRYLDNWRWYMADHEQKFRDLVGVTPFIRITYIINKDAGRLGHECRD